MARNFKETKKMKKILLFIFTIFTGFIICSNGLAEEQKQRIEFTIVFSANVNGELEPCG
jgi:hypothetical protein